MSATQLDHVDIEVGAFRALRDTLTLAELGAYSSLLNAYLCFGALPKDPAKLAELIGCELDEFAAVWPAVRRLCIEAPNGYRVPLPGGG